MSPATPRSRSTDRRYYGVVEAIVQEATGDDEGRVKLTFPCFDGSTVTDWCRVARPYAGSGRGFSFPFEKGDEVLVGFVHGDMRFPMVLGGLYNGKDKPPSAPVEGKDQKTIRTRHGHELTFDDQASQAAVRITSAAGHRVELDDEGKRVRLSAAGGGSVELDGGGAITIRTTGDITLEAGGAIHLRGTSIDLSSGQITLGKGVPQPLLLAAFLAHTHGTGVGPTTPAIPTPAPAAQTGQVTAS